MISDSEGEEEAKVPTSLLARTNLSTTVSSVLIEIGRFYDDSLAREVWSALHLYNVHTNTT